MARLPSCALCAPDEAVQGHGQQAGRHVRGIGDVSHTHIRILCAPP